MPDQTIPSDAPPSYNDAVKNSSKSSSHLRVPGQQDASSSSERIPLSHRRSMEDEARSLPPGWVRSYDPESRHQFFVDTTQTPPRSIWHHPYDDEQYLATLSSADRDRIAAESMHRGTQPSRADIMAAHSDDDDDTVPSSHNSTSPIPAELPPRPNDKDAKPSGARSFGRKMKNALTGTTHDQRVAERKRRDAYEQQQYQQHLRIRNGLAEAARTGQPVVVGRDREGNPVTVYPPPPMDQWGAGFAPYGSAGVGGMYSRPAGPYSRPGGGGYGGGYGLPLAMGGGLLGGLLLADMMI